MNTIVNSQLMDTNPIETLETNFSTTLLEDRTEFSSHTNFTPLLTDLQTKKTDIITLITYSHTAQLNYYKLLSKRTLLLCRS